MPMTLDEAHQYERELRADLEKINPENPSLKVYYGSTWEAIEAYEAAIRYERY